MNNKKISSHFWLSEFNGNRLDADNRAFPVSPLLHVLQKLRERTGEPVKVTDGVRSVENHISTYQCIYADKWQEKISWTSRHLAHWDDPLVNFEGLTYKGLCAVDFKCKRRGGGYYSGDEIVVLLKSIIDMPAFSELFGKCFWGIGIGKEYVHLDTARRKSNATWRYGY